MANKTQKQMKEELKRVIDNNKCFDYWVQYPPMRKEIFIKISTDKEVKY